MVATNVPARPGHKDCRAQGRAVVELPTRETIARALTAQRRERFRQALARADRERTELRHVLCWRIERALVKQDLLRQVLTS